MVTPAKKRQLEKRAARHVARERRGGKIVELGFAQRRLVVAASGSLTFAILACVYGRGFSWWALFALAFSLWWYSQATAFARERGTLLNTGAIDWRYQNVFIYWWCNDVLPMLVSSTTIMWMML